MSDFEIWGLSEGAQPKEIKRAYFKLVRQFSPEKDPERFQQIREAYEHLTEDRSKVKEGIITLEFPDIPLASQMKEQIQKRIDTRNYQEALATAEEAIKYFGEFEGFLYYLAISQRHLGKTGKSVKTFEKLVGLFPEKLAYRKELAFAYMERGFMNKAYQAFEVAYSKGVRDLSFLHMFSLCCKDRYMDQQAASLLQELINLAEKRPKENLELLIDSYGGIFSIDRAITNIDFQAVRKSLIGFLHSAEPYLAEYEEELLYLIKYMVRETPSDSDSKKFLRTVVEQIRQICSVNRTKKPDSLGEVWKSLDIFLEQSAIEQDKRLPEWLKENCFAFINPFEDPQLIHFVKRDTQLCILEEWTDFKNILQIIRDSYPVFYKGLQDFIQTLEHTADMNQLRSQLLKDYDRRAQYFNDGFYYRKYPDRRPKKPTTQWDSDTDGTYVRSQPKIGRNAPCPCGSGKKYKNCCGKNFS